MGVPAKGNVVEAATVSKNEDGIILSAEGLSAEDYKNDGTKISILSSKTITLSTATDFGTTPYIYIGDSDANDVNLVLDNFKAINTLGPVIEIEDNYAGNVTITLAGTATRNTAISRAYNAMQGNQAPAIQKNGTSGGKLTITGTGELWAENAEAAVATGNAAIGGSNGQSSSNIQIDGGVITAVSYSTGAAIGGGAGGDGNNITITGGDVKAVIKGKSTSDSLGAAIGGGGKAGDGNSITISGGTVYADASGQGTHGGAGIGGGHNGVANNVTITSTSNNPSPTVTAIGGGTGECGSAGIGAGTEDYSLGASFIKKKNTSIAIDGGVITATGSGMYGAGIGSGSKDDTNTETTTTVTITGGTIVAKGGQDAPGIGAGQRANSTTYISGGSVYAKGGFTATSSNSYTGEDIGFGEEQIANSGNYKKVLAYSSSDSETVAESNPFPYSLSSMDDFNNGEIELEFTRNGSSYTYGMKDVKSTDGKLYFYLKSGVTITEKATNGYTVTVDTPTNGKINATTTAKKGVDYSFTVTPDTDYKIASVQYKTEGGSYQTLSGNNGSYTIPAASITGNITIKADFEYKYVDVETESISNGTITATAKAEKGVNYTFTVEAANNYEITTVQYKIGNGTYKTLTGNNGSYTISGSEITDTVTLNATFTEKAPNQYTVTVQAGSGGTVTATELATEGEDFEFTVEAATDYKITAVQYKVQGGSDISLSGNGNTYTIPAANITGNITIEVEFEYKYVNVQTESVSNGTIKADTRAEKGESFTFNVEADDNYEIATVQYKIGNGTYKTVTGTDGSYTIPGNEITDTITLNATFVDSRGIPVDLSGITWKYNGPYYYKNDTYTVILNSEVLPTGIAKVTYKNNAKSAIGTYTATAEFVCEDGYYISKEAPSCQWSIEEYPVKNVALLYNGSSTLLDWYNNAVTLSAAGYKVADSANASSFENSITMYSSGSKTLYFQQEGTDYITTTGKEVTVQIDSVAPTGAIAIDGVTYSSLNTQTSITRHLYNKEITISSTDDMSGVKKTEYTMSDKTLTTVEDIINENFVWSTGTPNFESGKAIYVRITDKAGNITYVSTPVIVNDAVAPEITGSVSDITTTSANCNVSFSETSNYWYLLAKNTESVPSSETIKESGTAGKGTAFNEIFNGLNPNTTYKLYIVADDGMTRLSGAEYVNQTSVVCAVTFVTAQEDVNGIVLKYNDSTSPSEWYQGSVKITAEGYYISDSQSSNFTNKDYYIESTTSREVTKTLYFKNENGSTPISQGRDVTVKFDNTKPTGSISIDGKTYSSLNSASAKTCHLNSKEIAIESNDEHSGVAEVCYAMSDATYTTANDVENAGLSWKTGTPTFVSGKALYLRITDKVGNVQYVSTPVIINDEEAPKINASIPNITSTSVDYSIGLSDSNSSIMHYAYVLLGSEEAAPESWEQFVEKIEAGKKGETGMTSGSISGTLTNLDINTGYKLYVIAHDGMMRLDEVVSNPNYSLVTAVDVNTTKASVTILNQTYSVKSGEATSYTYNLQDMLKSSNVDVATMGNVTYSAKAESGNILSMTGTLEVSDSMLTIPVRSSFDEDIEQAITITIQSDNYEDITSSLIIKSVAKIPVTISGVEVTNKTYNGESQGYTGTIQWKNGEQICDVDKTNVQYVGKNGTNYGPSTDAPVDAGEYQVIFTVDSLDYEGTATYSYVIEKANLDSEMTNAAWYINGNKIYTDSTSVIDNGQTYTVSYKDYSDRLDVQYDGNVSESEAGVYTTTVRFSFKNTSSEDANNYNLPTAKTLYWTVVPKSQVTLSGVNVSDVIYNGTAQGYTGTIQWMNDNVACDVDSTTVMYEGVNKTSYNASATAPTDAGDYKVTFTVSDDMYQGEESIEYTIQKANLDAEMANASWYINGTKVYAEPASIIGNGQTYVVEYKDYSDKLDVRYSGTTSATEFASYTTTVSFAFKDTFDESRNYNLPAERILYWEIVTKLPVSLSGVNVEDTVYNGDAQGYTGTIQWMHGDQVCAVDGTTVTYEGVNETSYEASATAPTNAGDYKVTFTVNDDMYEGQWSKQYTIEKVNLNNEMVNAAWYINDEQVWSDSIDVSLGDDEYNVILKNYSDKVVPSYSGTQSASEAGSYEVKAEFDFAKPEYKTNYRLPDSMKLYWSIIDKITPDMSAVAWSYKQGDEQKPYTENETVLYVNGEEYMVEVTGLPEGVIAEYRGTCKASEAGVYTAEVTFSNADTDIYLDPRIKTMTLNWEIKDKVTPDMSNVKWVYQQNGNTVDYVSGTTVLKENGSVYKVVVLNLPEGVSAEYSGTYAASVAGNYTANVTFKNSDPGKYNDPIMTTMSLNWSIIAEEAKEDVPSQKEVPTVGSEKTEGINKYTVLTTSANGGTVAYKATTDKNVISVTIPATIVIGDQTYQVKSIAKGAFSGCKKLSSVTIQNGITTIGANAFKGCTKLKKITIPSSVTSIGSNAFSGCKVMTKATIGKNVKTIGNGAFSGCTKLSTVSVTSSAKLSKIGDKAFYKCTSLKKVTLPKNITTIGKSAFEGCKKLKTITIQSKKLKKVGSKAIKNINKNATIKCPNKSSANKYKKLFKSKTGYKKSMKVK